MKSTLSKALAALALGVLGMLAFVGPSHAARFIAHIDPQFELTGTFANLGFRGTATFNVPDTCLSGSDGWYSRVGSAVSPVSTSCFISSLSGGHIEMESAFIELYYLSDLDKLTQASATFGSSFSLTFCGVECVLTTDLIDKVLILNHDLVGINSQIMSSVAEDDPSNIFIGHMGLSFFTDCTAGSGPASTFSGCHDPAQIHLNGVASDPTIPQVFSITQIPEPTTLSLLLAALGASVFVQRRRRSVG